jgi:hypothetical protein
LAGEAQDVIDELVEDLFDRCVTAVGSNDVCISLAALATRPRYLVRELLTAVWRRAGWPLQAMSMLKWDELCKLATSTTAAKQVFPGGVTVEVADDEMRLTRRHSPNAEQSTSE